MASPSRLPSTRRPHGAMGGRSRPMSMIEPGFTILDPPTQNPATSRADKRRSLLPQLSRAGSAEYKEGADLGRENEDPEKSQVDDAEDVSAGDTRQADRQAMPPPPSKQSRPTSMRIPGSSQLGRAPSTRSHTRAQSSTTSTRSGSATGGSGATMQEQHSRNTAPLSGLQRTSSIRQPQQPPKPAGLSRTASIRAPQTQPHTRTGSTATATTTATATKRSAISTRPPAINTSCPGQYASKRSPTSPTKSIEARAGGRSNMPPPPRPSFNTFQQHYSPAKSGLPKPPLPSTRSGKPTNTAQPEEDTSVSFEVAKQQMELLQLSLLHQSSSKTLKQYTTSGKRKLGKRHAKLRNEFEAILAAEQERQRVVNLEALQAWCPDPTFLAENLQLLARIHRDLSSVTHSESRYSQLLSTFEDWVESAEPSLDDQEQDFVSPLSGQWREAYASVALKIRSLQREMATLPALPNAKRDTQDDDQQASSLETLVLSCRTLIDGTLKELDMMSKLEREILQREKARIDTAVAALMLTDIAGHEESEREPAWQRSA